MRIAVYALVFVPAALALTDTATSKKDGILPNTVVEKFNVGSLTRAATASCGQCHLSPASGVAVTVTPASRVIPAGQSTVIKVSGTAPGTSTAGGFVADVTKGTLVAGTNTKVNTAGTAITHADSKNRAWTFNWKAPSTPGLAEFYTVVNAANGNGFADPFDRWSFHGSSPTNTTSTPVRLYANTPGVKVTGTSCSDGYGNFSVLGVPNPPTLGNKSFRIEAFGMQPSSPMMIMLSLGGNVRGVDLGIMGAPSCVLRTLMQIQIIVATGPGDAARSEGSFVLPLPIPNDKVLSGQTFAAQFGFLDKNSSRNFPFTVTNGIEVTFP